MLQALNDHYVYIVEGSCGEKLTSIANTCYLKDCITIIDHKAHHYEDHLSIKRKPLPLILPNFALLLPSMP